MIGGLKSIRRERASLERDRVIMGSMMESEEIAELFESLDQDIFEGVSEDDIEKLIDHLPESDDEDAQVDRILASSTDMDVDEILDVNDESELSDVLK